MGIFLLVLTAWRIGYIYIMEGSCLAWKIVAGYFYPTKNAGIAFITP